MKIRTKADFRAVRESVGMTQQDVANEANVTLMTVKRWERPDGPEIPAEIVGFMAACRRTQDEDARRYVEMVRKGCSQGSRVSVPYYRTQEDLDAHQLADGQGTGNPVGYINTMSRKIALTLESLGYDVVFEYQDPRGSRTQ